MKAIYTLLVLFLLGSFSSAQQTSPVSPYPGGSPFPPGKEPSLTHTVKFYWTTREGMETRILVTAKGNRPIQLDCEKGGSTNVLGFEAVHSAIAPDCTIDLRLTSKKKNPGVHVEGHGYIVVRVYGFKKEDFTDPPKASVQYSDGYNGMITTTEVLPKPEKKDAQPKQEKQPVEPKPTKKSEPLSTTSQMPMSLLTTVLTPPTSVPVVKQLSWYQVQEEVESQLVSNKKDLIRWANELADQKPKDARAAMVKVQVMLQAGLDRHAAKAIGELKKFCRDTDDILYISLRSFYHQIVAKNAWNMALAIVETFPERIDSHFKIEEQLIKHLKQTGWSDERLAKWFKTMQQRATKDALPSEHWEVYFPPLLRPEIYWHKLLIDHQKEPSQKTAILASFEKAVRDNPTDCQKVLEYLEIHKIFGADSDSDPTQVVDLFQPQRSTDACKVAETLRQLGQWTSAAKLHRYAINTPLQKNESTLRCLLGSADQVALSSPQQKKRKRYQFQIRRRLGQCLVQLGKKEEGQKWLSEAATKYANRSRLQIPPECVGKDSQEASINEVEQRILDEEARSKGKADYWLTRAEFYEQWQRLDPKVDKKTEIEHAYQQGLDVAKPKPRPRRLIKKLWSTRHALFRGYLNFLESNKRYDDIFSLVTTEIQTVPADSESIGVAIRQFNSPHYRDRLDLDDPMFWKWLSGRKNWGYLEFNLLDTLAQKIKESDVDRQTKLYRQFVDRIEKFVADKTPSHTIVCAKIVLASSRLGIPAKPEDAIPWLQGVQLRDSLRSSSPHRTHEEKHQMKTVNTLLFDAYLASDRLKEAEKLISSPNSFIDRNRFRLLAIQAAKQGDKDIAMKAWHRVANVSLNDGISQNLKTQLRQLGLGDQIDAYYRKVKEKLPEFSYQ